MKPHLLSRLFRRPTGCRAAAGRFRPATRSLLDTAASGRLETNWHPAPLEIDVFIYQHWAKITARARHETRAGDHARKFLQLCRDNIAGPNGFTLQPQISDENGQPDKELSDALFDAYAAFSRRENHTVTGTLSRADVERLAIVEWARTGEFVAIIRRSPAASPHGIALQIVDPCRLDPAHVATLAGGNFIKHGIEFNPLGRPIAYHFAKENPFATIYGAAPVSTEKIRVPAQDVIHVFLPEYPNQKRGLTPMLSALSRLRVLQDYESAALINARVCAGKMGFFKDNIPANEVDPENPDSVPPDYLPIDAEAGTFQNIGNREFIKYDPQYPSNEFAPFTKACLRSIAFGLNVSYNNLASDIESVNFSSIRQGALDEREVWKGYQEVFITHLCNRVFEAWLPHALLSRQITVKGRPVPAAALPRLNSYVFAGRRWGWIDPSSEMSANEKALALGLKSRSQVMREQGGVPYSTWKEVQDERAEMQALGLDPAIVIAGATNVNQPPAPKPDAAGGEKP